MPALWSPDDLATRFAPYIEELHDVFAMHGLHYGSPEDIGPLAARLETPSQLTEEIGSLVRSMVLREGGSMPRTDLLEIVAIAISGPRMDPGGVELQQPVRQLLTFLHNSLRRPWNEPAGEERLHPEVDASRAEAARELREAAAKIEAESQRHDVQPAHGRLDETEGHVRANVIPFGRARAVFSRLAGTDGDGLPEGAPASQERWHERAQVPVRQEQEPSEEPAAPLVTLGSPVVVDLPATPEFATSIPSPEIADLDTPRDAPTVASKTSITDDPPIAQRVATREPKTFDEPMHKSALPTRILEPRVNAVEDTPREFDVEPPMPAPQRPMRIAVVSGAIAAILVAGLFGIASRGVSDAASPAPNQAQAKTFSTAKPSLREDANSTPLTASSGTISQAPSKPHAYDDYIAPPYSNMPPQSVATATAPAPTPQTATAAVAQQPVVIARPRDPDGIAVGDSRVRITPVALEEAPPLHPRVPAAVMAMNIIAAPRPDYPMLAKIAHVDGPVVIHAEIGRGGSVVDTDVISGHRLLRHAAEDAVRHWRYKPYEVDGRAVPVSTTITVRFRH